MNIPKNDDDSRNDEKIKDNLDSYNKKIDDIYIDTYIVHTLLSLALSKTEREIFNREGEMDISVPSPDGTTDVKRTSAQIKSIFEHAKDIGQWEKSLTMVISITEDYIASLMRALLRAKPLLLMTSIKANDGKLTVSLADMINSGSDAIIEDQVAARINNAIYASPKEYSKYIGKLLEFEIPPELIGKYIEIKARRDLIIHAGGVVNKIYLDKSENLSGDLAIGDKVFVDREYFEKSMSAIKLLTSCLTKQMRVRYGQDEALKGVIATKGF